MISPVLNKDFFLPECYSEKKKLTGCRDRQGEANLQKEERK